MSVFSQGFRVVPVEECWMKSLEPLMREVRAQMGDKPVYISFDIDGLDPAYAPGTGTPEIAGLTPAQVRGTLLPFPGGKGWFAPFKGGRFTSTAKWKFREARKCILTVMRKGNVELI